MAISVKGILDTLINKLPFVSKFNGYKTQLAGLILAIAVVLVQVSNFLPAEYAAPLLIITEGLKQLAQVLGVVGLAGKLVKPAEQLVEKK